MKTLYEALKPEYKLNLLEMEKKYPASHEELVTSLKNKYFYSYLTMSDALALLVNTTNKGISFTNLSELFEDEN